ncbi:MAG TPA: hypothetical protein VMU83_18635 [Hanamia sp.]|nr:hypothetical protein [Hanamia sp.]
MEVGWCSVGTITVITNPNNPEDYIGQQHNAGVTYVLNTLGGPSSDNSLILSAVTSYMQTLGYTSAQVDSAYNQGVRLGYLPFTNIPELDSLGNLMYSQGKLSATANSYVQQIYTLALNDLNQNVDSADYSSVSSSYKAFADSLISLESSISNNINLSSAEKTGLLSSCSVGRYSASYWANYIIKRGNGVGSMSLYNSELTATKHSFWYWLRAAVCDVCGAVLGSPLGIAGIICGAVGGSA